MPSSFKTFRVFISSTFADMKEERRILQKQVFPKLEKYCENKGARFQAVDLRWGVTEASQLEQKTLDICLGEIKRCQQISPKPNFLVLLGNRYGWQPIPNKVPQGEMQEIDKVIDEDDKNLLEKWYRLDENVIPAEFVLQARDNENIEFETWLNTENKIRNVFRNAVSKLNFSEQQKNKYFCSATHLEILNGALNPPQNTENPEKHVFAYSRNIKELPNNNTAIDYLDFDGEKPDEYSKKQLENLKGELKSKLKNNYNEYNAVWNNDKSIIEQPETFAKKVYKDLLSIIDKQIKETKIVDVLEQEIQLHKEFKDKLTEHFLGREDTIEKISSYINSPDDRTTFVLSGASGSGKSSIIAKQIDVLEKKNNNAVVIYRFIGSTSDSAAIISLLQSICKQIIRDCKIESEKQREDKLNYFETDLSELSNIFVKCLTYAKPDKPIVVCLDALDQLSAQSETNNLFWLPKILPDNVKIISTVLPELESNLQDYIIEHLPLLPQNNAEEILNRWLESINRKLTDKQQNEIINKFNQNGLPIFLKLAYEKAKEWKSYDTEYALQNNVSGIINDLMVSLEKEHTKDFVEHIVSYLLCGRYQGLTENELLEILVFDKDYWENKFLPQTHPAHREELADVSKIPIVVWSRLYLDLEPFLTERNANGIPIISFFHRQFVNVLQERYLHSNESKKKYHQKLAGYFSLQKIEKRYIVEYPFHLLECKNYESLNQYLKNLENFMILLDFSKKDLHYYWSALEHNSNYAIGDTYYDFIINPYPEDYIEKFAVFFEEREIYEELLELFVSYYNNIYKKIFIKDGKRDIEKITKIQGKVIKYLIKLKKYDDALYVNRCQIKTYCQVYSTKNTFRNIKKGKHFFMSVFGDMFGVTDITKAFKENLIHMSFLKIYIYCFFSFLFKILSYINKIPSWVFAKVVTEAIKFPDNKSKCNYFVSYGDILINKNEKKKALLYYNIAMETFNTEFWNIFYKNKKKSMEELMIMRKIAKCYFLLGRYNKALMLLKRLEVLFKNNRRNDYLALCYGEMGKIESKKNNKEKALLYFFKQENTCNIYSDFYGLLICFKNFAQYYQLIGDNFNSLKYYTKSIDICKKQGNKRGLSEILISIKESNKFCSSKLKIIKELECLTQQTSKKFTFEFNRKIIEDTFWIDYHLMVQDFDEGAYEEDKINDLNNVEKFLVNIKKHEKKISIIINSYFLRSKVLKYNYWTSVILFLLPGLLSFVLHKYTTNDDTPVKGMVAVFIFFSWLLCGIVSIVFNYKIFKQYLLLSLLLNVYLIGSLYNNYNLIEALYLILYINVILFIVSYISFLIFKGIRSIINIIKVKFKVLINISNANNDTICNYDNKIIAKKYLKECYLMQADSYSKIGFYEKAISKFNNYFQLHLELNCNENIDDIYAKRNSIIKKYSHENSLKTKIGGGFAKLSKEKKIEVINKYKIELYDALIEYSKIQKLHYLNYQNIFFLKEEYKSYLRAINILKDKPLAYILAGKHLYNLGVLNKSVVFFKKAIKYSNSDDTVYFYLSIVYFLKKNFSLALNYIDKSISINSKNGRYYYYKGLINKELKRENESMLSFEKSFDLGYEKSVIFLKENEMVTETTLKNEENEEISRKEIIYCIIIIIIIISIYFIFPYIIVRIFIIGFVVFILTILFLFKLGESSENSFNWFIGSQKLNLIDLDED